MTRIRIYESQIVISINSINEVDETGKNAGSCDDCNGEYQLFFVEI